MNKFCTQCGAKLELGLKFCTECGQAQDESVPPPNSGAAKSSLQKVVEAPKSESAPSAPARAPTVKTSTPSSQATQYTTSDPRTTEVPVSSPVQPTVKASAESPRAPAQPSPIKSDAPLATESSGKRNYLVIGLIAAVIAGGAGFFLTGKSSPSATSASKADRPLSTSTTSATASKSPTGSAADAAISAKGSEPVEIYKLIMAMVDATKAKDEAGMQKALDEIKQMPVPRRGDRSTARAANATGLTKLQANQPSEAVASFREGVTADPSDAEIVNNLGYALSLAGKEVEAIEAFAKAISLAPDRASAWANLAVSFAKTNQMDKGVASYLLAYKFSKAQDKTRNFLVKQSEEASDERERDLSQRVLKALDQL